MEDSKYCYRGTLTKQRKAYKGLYKAKIDKMNAEKEIDTATALIKKQQSKNNIKNNPR